MPRKDRTNTYIVSFAVLAAVVAGYYLPTKRPETSASMTPKEYFEVVEQKKAQRLRYAEAERDPDRVEPTADGEPGARP